MHYLVKPLPPQWFIRTPPSAARGLLGRTLIAQQSSGRIVVALITEVEAYSGPWDKASHARFGYTPRSAVMFDTTGAWYLYFIYGMHWLANITVGPVGKGGAVLLRAVWGVEGPARLVRTLALSPSLTGSPALPESGAWVSEHRLRPQQIISAPRVGITYAPEPWRSKHWRFSAAFSYTSLTRWMNQYQSAIAPVAVLHGPLLHEAQGQ